MSYSSSNHTYELIEDWAKCPEGWPFSDVAGLSIDSEDRIYILNRGEHPVMVFDREGNLLTSFGEGFFNQVHGIQVCTDGSVYCTDYGNHTVSKFSQEGKLLQVLGKRDQPSKTGYVRKPDYMKSLATIKFSGPPFNRPTGVAFSPTGEIYISDGYGNARVHKFSPDGTLLSSWGEPGSAPGQFRCPHCVVVDKQGHVWVADRENHRIQIFNSQGEFLSQWTDFIRPNDIFIDNEEETVYVAEIFARPKTLSLNSISKPGLRLSIFSLNGELIARWDSIGQSWETATFLAPHAIVVDSWGDIYVGEVPNAFLGIKRGPRAIRKFARIT